MAPQYIMGLQGKRKTNQIILSDTALRLLNICFILIENYRWWPRFWKIYGGGAKKKVCTNWTLFYKTCIKQLQNFVVAMYNTK